MHDGDERVRVTLRGRALAADARLTRVDGEHPLFLALPRPLPVGTHLEVAAADGRGPAWVFEVRRVVEALWRGPGGLRGCFGRRVDVDLAAWDRRVGSEHLADAIAARRLRLCAAPADDAAAAPAGASVIRLRQVADPAPRAAGGGKLRRGRARR